MLRSLPRGGAVGRAYRRKGQCLPLGATRRAPGPPCLCRAPPHTHSMPLECPNYGPVTTLVWVLLTEAARLNLSLSPVPSAEPGPQGPNERTRFRAAGTPWFRRSPGFWGGEGGSHPPWRALGSLVPAARTSGPAFLVFEFLPLQCGAGVLCCPRGLQPSGWGLCMGRAGVPSPWAGAAEWQRVGLPGGGLFQGRGAAFGCGSGWYKGWLGEGQGALMPLGFGGRPGPEEHIASTAPCLP